MCIFSSIHEDAAMTLGYCTLNFMARFFFKISDGSEQKNLSEIGDWNEPWIKFVRTRYSSRYMSHMWRPVKAHLHCASAFAFARKC